MTVFCKQGKRVSSCTKEEWPTLKDESSTTDIYLMLFSDLNDFGVKTKVGFLHIFFKISNLCTC